MDFVKLDINKLTKEYQNGLSLRQLAIQHNTSKLTIKRKLENSGVNILSSSDRIKKFSHKHKLASAHRYNVNTKLIIKLYKTQSISEISSTLNLPEATIGTTLKNNNIKIRNIDIKKRFRKIYKKPKWSSFKNLHRLYIIKQKSANHIASLYGVDPETIRAHLIANGIPRRKPNESTFIYNKKHGFKSSKLECIVGSILSDFHIKHEKVMIHGFEFDLAAHTRPKKTLIEVNGSYSHLGVKKKTDSAKMEYWRKNLRDTHNYIIIWEHEFTANTSVFNILNKQMALDFLDIPLTLKFKKVLHAVADGFYAKYHYLGKTRNGVHIGAYYGDTLVCCGTFSWCTRKQSAKRLGMKNCELRELSRFCIHPRYKNKNMGSYCMSNIIKFIKREKNIKKLITFADTSCGHNGTLYKASNWKADGETGESYFYVRENQKWHKRTIWGHARSAKMTEGAYAALFCIKKIKTSKKLRFTYDL